MEKIRVLALNDDYHAKTYVTRDNYLGDAADFMKQYLLKPHTQEYEVREIYICDPNGILAEMAEEDFVFAFELLDLYRDMKELEAKFPEQWKERQLAFDLFWDNAEVWNYA